MNIDLNQQLPLNFKDKKVCVIGLGYVGLTLAVTLADIGFDIIGIENNEKINKKLKKGIPHFYEQGLEGRILSVINSGKLQVYRKIPKKCDSTIFIITVGTPIDEKNNVNKKMIYNVCDEMSCFLKKGDLIILRSTVEVGTTNNLKKKILNKTNIEFDIAFCPERTIEGKAMTELRSLPQIIGTENMETSMRLSQFFSFMTPTVVRVSNCDTAELIKLIDNCQRDVNFALSNEIAEISDEFGISAFEVINAGKLGYPRTNLPVPGPVGGPCLEKDSYILNSGLKKYDPKIIMESRSVNKNQPKKSIKLLSETINYVFKDSKQELQNLNITIAGAAFKGEPETNDLRGSMTKPILTEVKRNFPNSKIKIYDPIVTNKELKQFLPIKKYLFTDSLKESFLNSSIYIICNNHPLFSSMAISGLSKKMNRPAIIFDYWNNFSEQKITFPNNIIYVGLGSLGKTLKKLKV